MTQAAEAFAAGQAALAAGDRDAAIRWLDRALRLAPGAPDVALALAAACLGTDPARAVALFAGIPAAARPREAWFGLAAALLASGDRGGAIGALRHALAAFVLPEAYVGLAEAVAGAAGWCGVAAGGRVVASAGAVVAVDGQVVSEGRLGLGLGRVARVRLAGREAVGSPLRRDTVFRVEGTVWAEGSGIRGWVWLPGDPDAAPAVEVRAGGATSRVACAEAPETVPGLGPLARPRVFAACIARWPARGVRVLGPDGRDLWGSPAMPPPARDQGERTGAPAAVSGAGPLVVFVLGGSPDGARARIAALRAACPDGVELAGVIAADSDARLRRAARGAAEAARVRLVPARPGRGVGAAVAACVAASAGRDVILLAEDTWPAAGWIDRLAAVAATADRIGAVTAFSNGAGLARYGENDAAPELPALAWRVHGARALPMPPVGGEGCVFVRRACWEAAGPFADPRFVGLARTVAAFLCRAGALGWRHVAAPGVFVARAAGAAASRAAASRAAASRAAASRAAASRAAATRAASGWAASGWEATGWEATLEARDAAVLARLAPSAPAELASFQAADPFAPARRRLDRARFLAAPRAPAVLVITHADGGGVERCVQESCRAHRTAGRRPIVLRPARGPGRGRAAVLDGDGFPDLRFALPRELAGLRALLRRAGVTAIELHHLLGQPPAIAALVPAFGVPYEVRVHDAAWFCPRIQLIRPAAGEARYCGEPDAAGCAACIATHGTLLDEPIGPGALQARSAWLLGGAVRRVVPSADAARRMARHFPGLRWDIAPPEDDAGLPPRRHAAPGPGRIRICVVGAIGPAKGIEVVLACARDAAARDLALEFAVVGTTSADAALLATGRAFVTGPFRPGEATALIGAQRAALGFLPSIWPETWCFALSDAWRAGLDVAAFDLGAPGERIRATGRGFLMPPGIDAARVNHLLLAGAARAVHE